MAEALHEAGEAGAAPPEPAVSLEWVIGCSTVPNSVHAVSEDCLFYVAGNVGVLYWQRQKRQSLLRGHVSRCVAC